MRHHFHLPRRRLTPAMLTLAATVAMAIPSGASANLRPFHGAAVQNPGATFTTAWNGTAYPRLYCQARTFGWCAGTIKLVTSGGRVLGSAPISVRSHDGPSVEVPLSRPAKSLLRRQRRMKVVAVVATHDLQGLWKTTRSSFVLRAHPGW